MAISVTYYPTKLVVRKPGACIVCDFDHPDQPMLDYLIRDAFYAALEGIDIADRKERRIAFHSLRR